MLPRIQGYRLAQHALHRIHVNTKQQRCFLSFGRMIDMGGMPSGMNDQSPIRTVNASKNSKLQAVAFEFQILTRSLDHAKEEEAHTKAQANQRNVTDKLTPVQPDMDQIQQVASLLNVSVDTGSSKVETKKKKQELPKTSYGEDIRAKYAAKLKGGLAGIELAKSQLEDTLKGGDAAGHLAAREMAVKETAASPSKWMALTGTGKLLSYLSHRSIRLALLPSPKLSDLSSKDDELKFMTDFSTQLKDVVIDHVVPHNVAEDTGKLLELGVLKELDTIHANKVMLVSDKDEYLKAAKDLGMITCRLRPQNARRGNITAHYTVGSIPEVQDVVNEITGISFNAVLNR